MMLLTLQCEKYPEGGGSWRRRLMPSLLLLCILAAVMISPIEACPKCPALKWCSSSASLQALVDVSYPQTPHGEDIYGGCNIPDPNQQPQQCGFPVDDTYGPSATNNSSSSSTKWMCDPNKMLKEQQVSELQAVLSEVNSASSECRCGNACTNYIPNPIMLAVIQHMRMPDLADEKCKTTSCFDVYPQRDPEAAARAPAESEIKKGFESFKYNLPERWTQAKCKDYVFIVYVALNQQFHVYPGSGLPVKESSFASSTSQAHDHVVSSPDELKVALETLVRQVAAQVNSRDNTALIIGVSCTVAILVIIVFGMVISVKYYNYRKAQGLPYHNPMSMGL